MELYLIMQRNDWIPKPSSMSDLAIDIESSMSMDLSNVYRGLHEILAKLAVQFQKEMI